MKVNLKIAVVGGEVVHVDLVEPVSVRPPDGRLISRQVVQVSGSGTWSMEPVQAIVFAAAVDAAARLAMGAGEGVVQ